MKKIIFGTGKLAKKVSEQIGEVAYYLDNNKDKHGKMFLGKEVKLPQEILNEKSAYQIIIASSFFEEIKKQLLEMGLIQSKDFINSEEIIVESTEEFNVNLIKNIDTKIDNTNILIAKTLIEKNNKREYIKKLFDLEFKVFSQWGEDGIIQYLINKVDIPNKVFVEFGVEDYTESNTRFLLINNNWSGTVIEMDEQKVKVIKNDEIYYKYDLTAVNSFITKENINELIFNSGVCGDIGLLSVDIDGNDYWIWNEIDVINPRIVICEYNNLLSLTEAVTVPYKSDFYRTNEHYSNLYYGANLLAMAKLAKEKGYKFVGTNMVGTNAFFVREDVGENLPEANIDEYNVYSKIRESRNENGQLTYLKGTDRIREIEGLPVYVLEKGEIGKIKYERSE